MVFARQNQPGMSNHLGYDGNFDIFRTRHNHPFLAGFASGQRLRK